MAGINSYDTKVRCVDNRDKPYLTLNKIYDSHITEFNSFGKTNFLYGLEDDRGIPYIYPSYRFEVVPLSELRDMKINELLDNANK